MNSGLSGALGTQPLKTQRIFNSPYGSFISIPNNIANTTVNPTQNRANNDTPGFQVKDSNNRKAFVISPDSGGQRTITFQSSQAPVGAIVWNGFDRTVTLGFNNYIYTNSYFSSVFYSSTTIGGGRFSASNGNGTLSHFQLWDDGQTTADVLALRNSTNAQAFRAYNTFTSLTNFERFNIDWQTSPNTCVLGTSAAGSGTVRGIDFRVGSTTAMSIASGGSVTFTATTITPAANNNALAVSSYSLTGSNAQSLLDLSGTWNTSGTPSAIKLNITDTASNASSLLLQLQTGGVNRATITKTGLTTLGSSAIAGAGTVLNLTSVYGTSTISVGGGGSFATSGAISCGGTVFTNLVVVGGDLGLYRDEIHVFALRSGTNAQASRTYNTFTSSTNFERFTVDWRTTANTCRVGTEKGSGGGTARELHFMTDGIAAIKIDTSGGIDFSRLTATTETITPTETITLKINGVARKFACTPA